MSRQRKPSTIAPNGWEKTDKRVKVGCTESEKLVWQMVFGRGNMADTARRLLNREAKRLAKV